jgi:hypothetical protein
MSCTQPLLCVNHATVMMTANTAIHTVPRNQEIGP